MWVACWVGTSASRKHNRPTSKTRLPVSQSLTICWADLLTAIPTLTFSVTAGAKLVVRIATKSEINHLAHILSIHPTICPSTSLCCIPLSPLSSSPSPCLSLSVIYAKCSQVEDVGFSRNFSRCCLCAESWMCPWDFRSGSFPGNWLNYRHHSSQYILCVQPINKIGALSIFLGKFQDYIYVLSTHILCICSSQLKFKALRGSSIPYTLCSEALCPRRDIYNSSLYSRQCIFQWLLPIIKSQLWLWISAENIFNLSLEEKQLDLIVQMTATSCPISSQSPRA